jgi:Mg2+ and Co2+ transporter CorA
MSTMVFVNFPVTDIQVSTAFYEKIGFKKNPDFSDDLVSCMVWDENFYIMLLSHERYQTFIGDKTIADKIYDIYIETDQAYTETRIQLKLLQNLRDLFSNIVSNNLNIVMKIMTSATFVLGIPGVVVGFYGMNVPIPGQEISWVMWAILGLTLIFCGIVVWALRKKDML